PGAREIDTDRAMASRDEVPVEERREPLDLVGREEDEEVEGVGQDGVDRPRERGEIVAREAEKALGGVRRGPDVDEMRRDGDVRREDARPRGGGPASATPATGPPTSTSRRKLATPSARITPGIVSQPRTGAGKPARSAVAVRSQATTTRDAIVITLRMPEAERSLRRRGQVS